MHSLTRVVLTGIAFCFVVSLTATTAAVAQTKSFVKGDMVNFSRIVDSLVNFPPMEKNLEIKKTKVVDGKYVSFIGLKGSGKVFIAAVTLKPIKNINKDLITTVDFNGSRPSTGNINSWGYIFDRNLDDKIDFMGLLGGAAAVEPADFPNDYPPRGVVLSDNQLEYFANHCQLLFNDWGDDNFDGKVDGTVHIDMDPFRDWVKRRLVIRSSKFNGKFDEVWAFRGNMEAGEDTVDHTPTSVPYRPINGKPSAITAKSFAQPNEILSLLNRAAKLAGLTRNDFVRDGNFK